MLQFLIRKSQLSLFDYQPSRHEEVKTVHAGTRHLASGAVVQVAEHQRKVQVRGKEGTEPKHGEKIYYRTPEMNRKKRGHIVGGSHETGYEVKPVREGYTLNPPHIKDINRDHIWTEEEHTAEKAPKGTGGRVTAEESTRRALVGMERIGMPEAEILQHPAIVDRMKGTLKHLASRNGYNPNYVVANGVLHNDDPAANELYSEYITAAIGALRTSGTNASDADIQEFKDYLAGTTSESNVAKTIARTGKTAAMRHLIANNDRLKEEQSYDTQGEDDYETGMRDIAAQAAVGPANESNAAKQEGLANGIAEQLDALDDPIASAIIKMKFGLGRFDHGYKEQDIAAALNRTGVRSEAVDKWDATAVKAHMQAALVRLARTKGAKELLGFLKSLRELNGELLIKSHVKEYTRNDGTLVKEHDDKRTKKHPDILAHQNTHSEEIHSGAKLKHGEGLILSLRDSGWKERETHQVKPTNGAIGGKKEDLPKHEEIKAKNRDNGALQTAERSMKKMREAAMSSDDPVTTLKNINTSRSNTYTAAIDNYREKLLNHLGHSVDRNKTATKFEKDGHSVVLSQEGAGHTVHFAGSNPDHGKKEDTSKVNPSKQHMRQAITKLGGIDSKEAKRLYDITKDNFPAMRGCLKKDGLDPDKMGELLAEHGYIKKDVHGKYDNNDFQEKLRSAASGDLVYSQERDHNAIEAEIKRQEQEFYASRMIEDPEKEVEGFSELHHVAQKAYKSVYAEAMDVLSEEATTKLIAIHQHDVPFGVKEYIDELLRRKIDEHKGLGKQRDDNRTGSEDATRRSGQDVAVDSRDNAEKGARGQKIRKSKRGLIRLIKSKQPKTVQEPVRKSRVFSVAHIKIQKAVKNGNLL